MNVQRQDLRLAVLLTGSLLFTAGCEAIDALSNDTEPTRTREASTPRDNTPNSQPPRKKAKKRMRSTAPSGTDEAIQFRDELGVRFKNENLRLAPGETREVTVLLDGPEEYDVNAYLAYTLDTHILDIPAGAVSFDVGERVAKLTLVAKPSSASGAREATVVFEKIEFGAAPPRFEHTVVVQK